MSDDGVPIADAAVVLNKIQETIDLILTEVRELKRQSLPAEPEEIGALLAAIYIFYPDSTFTASWILEYAIDPDPDSVTLRKAITAAIGHKTTINKLSRFLRRSVGVYGNIRLQVIDPHSRDGATFRVMNVTE